MIQNASNKPKTGIISTVLGIIALIFGAGGVVGQLQASLNTIWGVTAKPGQGMGALSINASSHLLVSFVFATALFAMIYKVLPDVRIQWRDAWIGAALTSFLFTIGKFLIGFYLGSSGVTSAYGAAGSLITILLWVYYSSLIFFLGAEFTQVYALSMDRE
jgi:membrane protein